MRLATSITGLEIIIERDHLRVEHHGVCITSNVKADRMQLARVLDIIDRPVGWTTQADAADSLSCGLPGTARARTE